MTSKLSFREFEKRIDDEGLVWEKKQQLERALEAYDLLMREVEAVRTETVEETREKDAIVSYLMLRKAGILMESEKIGEAEKLMRGSVELAERSGNATVKGRAKLGLGVYYGSTGKIEEAEKLLNEALEMFSGRSDYDSQQGAGWCLLNIGGLQLKKANLKEAEEKLTRAVEVLEKIENWVGVASAYEMKAKASKARNDHASAKENLAKAITFYEKEGMKEKADQIRDALRTL